MTDDAQQLVQTDSLQPISEAGSLAREMASAYKEMVEHYKKEMPLPKAMAKAGNPTDTDVEQLDSTPPDQLSWWLMGVVNQRDPATVEAAWKRALAEAHAELVSGHRAASAVEANATPWQRARFMAVLNALVADLEPRGAAESILVEMMAQAYSQYLLWLARLTVLTHTEADSQDREIKKRGRWQPPTVKEAATLDQASAMADRFNKMYLRTHRTFSDQRRRSSSVVVQKVNQLNLAQAQVNVTRDESPNDRE